MILVYFKHCFFSINSFYVSAHLLRCFQRHHILLTCVFFILSRPSQTKPSPINTQNSTAPFRIAYLTTIVSPIAIKETRLGRSRRELRGCQGGGRTPSRPALCTVSVISGRGPPLLLDAERRPPSRVPYLNANELHFAILMRLARPPTAPSRSAPAGLRTSTPPGEVSKLKPKSI